MSYMSYYELLWDTRNFLHKSIDRLTASVTITLTQTSPALGSLSDMSSLAVVFRVGSAKREAETKGTRKEKLEHLMPKAMQKASVPVAAFTLSEACRYLNVSEATLHRMLKRGELKGNRKLGRWLFPIENLQAWLKE